MPPLMLVGFASVIPGLGFWLLRQYWRSLGAFVLTVVSLGAAMSASLYLSESVSRSIWYVTFMIWAGQIYFSVDTADLLNKQSAKNVKHTVNVNLQGLSKSERFEQNVLEAVKKQLESSEKLQAAIFGFNFVDKKDGVIMLFPIRPLYLALTDTDLVIIKTDFLGVPMILERSKKNQIKSFDFKQGFINDTLRSCYIKDGQTNYLEIKVSFRLREQIKSIISLTNPSTINKVN